MVYTLEVSLAVSVGVKVQDRPPESHVVHPPAFAMEKQQHNVVKRAEGVSLGRRRQAPSRFRVLISLSVKWELKELFYRGMWGLEVMEIKNLAQCSVPSAHEALKRKSLISFVSFI